VRISNIENNYNIMKTITEVHNGKQLTISEDEYLDFKHGDKYYYNGNRNGYAIIMGERMCQLANRQIEPKYYLESAGGKHLVLKVE